MSPFAEFSCSVSYENPGSVRVIALKGKLDQDAVTELDAVIERELQTAARRFVLNLEHLDYVGSLGLRSFVKLYKAVKEDGAVCAVNPTKHVQTVLDISRFGQVVRVLPTLAEGLEFVRNPSSQHPGPDQPAE